VDLAAGYLDAQKPPPRSGPAEAERPRGRRGGRRAPDRAKSPQGLNGAQASHPAVGAEPRRWVRCTV